MSASDFDIRISALVADPSHIGPKCNIRHFNSSLKRAQPRESVAGPGATVRALCASAVRYRKFAKAIQKFFRILI